MELGMGKKARYYLSAIGMGKKARYYLSAIYKPNEKNDKRVKILGRNFIKKNKDKAKILYKNKIYELYV